MSSRSRCLARRPRFGNETPQAVRVGISSLVEDLERDFAMEPRIPGAIDLAHPSAAEWGADFIRRESSCAVADAGLHARPREWNCISRIDIDTPVPCPYPSRDPMKLLIVLALAAAFLGQEDKLGRKNPLAGDARAIESAARELLARP